VNPAPALAAIGNKSVNENALLQFAVSAADPDGGIPALTATNVPIGASFADHGDGTGTFTWTPTFAQQGAYANVTFTATDAGAPPLADSEPIAITVNDVNRAPSLGAIGNKSVNENSLLQFNVTATDIDNNGLALSATSLPSGASFVDNGNGTGTFSWTPTFEQSGSYANIGIGAIDDAQEPLSDAKTFSITVNNTNRAPSLALIGDKSVNENSLLQFNVSATDPDGTVPALDVSNLPIGAAFVDNGNGTGTFSWTPTYEQSGVHTNIGISVTDADQSPLSDTKTFSIMVNDVNRAPVLTAIGNQTVIEGQILQVNVSATDADGTTPVLGASNLPPSASFVDNHDGTGTFTWATTFSDSGTYLGIVITATDAADAGLADQKSFNVTVTDENRKPSIDPVPDLSVHEADTVQFVVTASDPDGTIPSLQCTNLPLNAAFIDYGDGTGLFDWLVSYDAADGSPYQLQFIASDGLDTGTASCTITVANTNRPIVLEPIGGQNAVEGQLLSFVIHASSYDVKPAVTAAGMPARARLAELETGDYAFQWTPDYHASENTPYSVTFTADNGESLQSETVLIAVTDATAPGDIVVSRPKAGANWTLGSDGKFKIKWNSVGDVGNKVSIELWRKGAFVSKIKASTANDGAFAWDVPTTSTPGAGYSIRVVSKSNPLVYGKSSGSFTITGSGKIDKD
jgi:phage-related protein